MALRGILAGMRDLHRAPSTLTVGTWTDEQFAVQIQRQAKGSVVDLSHVEISTQSYEGVCQVDAGGGVRSIDVARQAPLAVQARASLAEQGIFQVLLPVYDGPPIDFGASKVPCQVIVVQHVDAARVRVRSMSILRYFRQSSSLGVSGAPSFPDARKTVNDVDFVWESAPGSRAGPPLLVESEEGHKGPDGDQGPQGPVGDKGPDGDQGSQGPVGDKGPDGDQGPRGPVGDKGPDGDQGPRGPVGDKGPDGDQGPRGPVGDKGPDGDQGSQGPVGDKGPDGDASADTALSTRLAAVEAKTQDLTIPTPATGFANVTDATVASIAAYGGAINTESEADLQTLARAIPAGDWAVQLGRINSEYVFVRIPSGSDPRNYQILDTPSIHGFQPATLPISGFIASGDSADSNAVYDYYLSNGTLANDAALALQATASVAHHGTTDFAGTVTGELDPDLVDTDAIRDNAVTSAKLSAAVRQSIVDAGNSGGSSSTPSAAGPLAATAITARSAAFDSAAEQRVALTPARADSWFAGKQILVDVSYTAQTQADLHFSGIVQGGDIPASAAGYRLHVQGQGGAYLVIRRISSGGTTTAFGVTDSTGFGGTQSAIQIRFYVLEGAKGDKGDQGDPGSGGLTQDQVDARVGTVGDARYLQLSGGELTGALTLHSEPAVDAQAANKGYVDRSTAALQNALLVFDALPDPSNYQVGQRVEIGLTQYGLTSGVANNLSVTVGHQVFGNAQNNRFGFVSHAFGNIDRALPELGTPLHNPTVASGGSLAQAVTVLRQGTGNPSTFSAYALVDAAEYARAKGSAAVRNDPLRVTANDGNSAVTLLLRRQAATVTVRGVDYLAFSVEANQDPGQTSTTIFRFWSLVSGADGDDVDFAFNASSTGASSNRLIGSETGWTALPNEPFEALQDRVDHLTSLVNHNTQLLSANSLDPSGTTWGSVDSSAQVGLYATPSQASLALVTTALAQDSFDAGDISFTENVTRFIYIVVPHGQGGNYRLRYDHTDGTSSYVRVSTLWNLGNGTANGNQVTFYGDYGAASVTPAIAGIDLEVSSTVEEPRFNGTLGPHTVRVLSQTAYDAIPTKEAGVIYMVPET